MRTAAFLLFALLACRASAHNEFASFEARHVHPIALTPDGSRLLALNSADAHLSVFDVSNATNPEPVLIAEIPVGLEPCSVCARTNDEVWVVNEESDSVSIVSLSAGVVVETLHAADEPADVVFALGKAFVSCARSHLIRVFDVSTRLEITTIPLTGNSPRALCTDAVGTRVFAAFLHSGNQTTILPATQAPPQPAPTNTALPAPPQTALIVSANDPRVGWSTLDHDVAEIDAATLSVTRYLSGAGTSLFDLAARPGAQELWVANTEALNLTRFEPALRGHIADHRLSRMHLTTSAVTAHDLNPGIDYGTLPNPAAQATALAQPTALVFAEDGATLWITAFASDRVAKISATTGSVLARVDVRTGTPASAAQMRGPRGLAWQQNHARLFVLNKLADTISTIDTQTLQVTAEIPNGSHNPMPPDEREGRGFLFDARLSGNGTASCSTCHIDADHDALAWDLGDPGGDLATALGMNLSQGDPTPQTRTLHPMKGPMTTQTLRGISNGAPHNRRGDKPALDDFNPIYDKLLGSTEISAAEMETLTGYLATLRTHPNPHLNLNATLPATLNGGNPTAGKSLFLAAANQCSTCHAVPGDTQNHGGTVANNIDLNTVIGATQFIKNPSLATAHQRSGFSRQTGTINSTGFGLLHDGSGSSSDLPLVHALSSHEIDTPTEIADVAAFILCFSGGTAPTVGHSRTITTQNRSAQAVVDDIALLEAATAAGRSDLVVRGIVGGVRRSYFYSWFDNSYVEDRIADSTITRAALLAALQAGEAITFMGVLPGEGVRFSIDRNFDGIVNGAEPKPGIHLFSLPGAMQITWPEGAGDWMLESNTTLTAPWQLMTHPRARNAGSILLEDDINMVNARFYRLRRVW